MRRVKSLKKILALGFVFLLVFTIPTTTVSAEPQKIPVVILFKNNLSHLHKTMIESNGGIIKKSFKIINGYATSLSPSAIEKLKNDPEVASIDNDIQVKALDTAADTQIRANQIWAVGDTGQGVPIAILDTGIDNTHPEFLGRILKCHSEITNTDSCDDQNGHGTHTAGIAAASGVNPQAEGVAPQASLYIDQVLDSTGSGPISEIISGIDWAVANNAKIISMSLGTNPLSVNQPNCDNSIPSLTTAVNNAVAAGITVVAAAGNSGSQGIGAPGCISSTIAVGAVDNTDTIASFSSRGGAMRNHGISAPGVNILSSVPIGSCMLCDPTGYTILSGTSMATPHIAGTIALMLEANPSLTPATIKSTLFSNACTGSTTPSCPTGTVPNANYGFGRVDAFRSYSAALPQLPSSKLILNPIKPSSVPWGNSITVTGKLTNATGAAIGSKIITFTGTGATGLAQVITNAAGNFTSSGFSPSNVTSGLTVQAHFSGDSSFKPSDSSVMKYNTIQHRTAISLALSSSTVIHGNTFKIGGKLKDSVTGTFLTGKTITFTADSPITISNVVSDATGTYVVTGLIAPSLTGTYHITAHFGGESLYTASDSITQTLTIT